MERNYILSILYEMALVIGGEVRVKPLLTKTLQRLLNNTSFPAGFVCLEVPSTAPDSGGMLEVHINAAVGDYELTGLIGQTIRLPAQLLRGAAASGEDAALLAALPDKVGRYKAYLRLPIDGQGVVVLLAPQLPDTDLPLTQLFQPVMANLAKAILLCSHHEAYTGGLIAARDASQQALAASEEKFRAISAATLDALIMVDDSSALVYWNPAAERILGYRADEVLGKPLHQLLTPQRYQSRADQGFSAFRNSGQGALIGKTTEIEALHKDGREIPIELSISALKLNGHWHAVGILRDITERKHAEETLRVNEERLKLATSAGNIGIWDWDVVRNELTWDESMYALYGVLKEDFGGAYDAWIRTLHPDDRQATDGEIQAALRGEREYAPEFRIIRPDGSVRSIKAASKTYYDDEGKPVRMIGTNIDITDRKEAEEVALAGSQYARSLIEASLDPLVTISAEGKITDVNRATEEVTGQSRGELIGTDFSDYFNEPDKARAGYRQVFETGFVTDYPLALRHRDGHVTEVLYNASVYRNEAGEVLGVFAAARDVTELNKAEQEARQLALQNRLVLDSAGEGIYGLDTEGRCTFVNPAAVELLGFSVEEMLGQHLHPLFHHTRPDGSPYPAEECPIQTAYRQGEVHRGSDLYWRKDGSSFPVDFVSTPIMSEGNITGAVVMFNDITERQQAEEELQLSRESLNEAQRIAHLGSWHMDLATNEVVWSDVLYQMYGFDPALPPPYTESMKLFTPESWEKLSTAIARAVETGISYELELEMVPKEGRAKWMLARGELVRDERGTPVRVRGVVMDITERKLAEVNVRESEHFLDSLIEHLPNMLFVKDAQDLRFVRFNKAGEVLLGYSRDELIGKSDYDFFPKEQAEFFITKDREIFASRKMLDIAEEPISTKFLGKRYLHTRKIPLFSEDGSPRFLLGISEDITERKLADEQLRRSEQGLSEAQRMAHLGNWELDLASDELIWSDEIFRIFEIDKDKFAATYEAFLNAIYPEDRDRVNNAYTESLKNRKPYEIEHRLQMPDGRIKYVYEKCETYFGEDGKPLRSIGTVHDITERKRVEDELRRYKDHLEEEIQQRTADLVLARNAADTANRAKSVFLANMSHELRTPLNAILGFSSLMSKDPLLQPEQHENLDIINRSGEHLLVLINDVLEMSKIEAGRVELENSPFDLGGMVRDVSDMMHVRAKERGLQLLVEQSSKVPRYINGDEARLRQVLINLVGNAVKFTQQGGVTLRFGVKSDAEREHLLIEVEDSGIGIKPEDQQRIFEPFVQLGEDATQKGTGLGLPLARQYVQLMGGKIDVESTPGKGSVFRVELPLEVAEDAEVSRKKGNVPQDVIGLVSDQPEYRVMIAEDQRENQLLLARLMNDIGISVKAAENGAQAVELFQSWHPHLIWMDRRMPVMDGIEATRRIRELPGGKEVKIVAVTASAFTEQRDEMLKVGMDDFVRKPYRFNEIYECMGKQLGIKYTYANQGAAEPANEVQLTAEMLAVLPVALRDELRAALESLESERISTVIRQVSAYDPALTKTLSHIAENFDYPAILKALQNQSTGKVT